MKSLMQQSAMALLVSLNSLLVSNIATAMDGKFISLAPINSSSALVSLQSKKDDTRWPELWKLELPSMKKVKLPQDLEFEHLTLLDAFYHRQKLFAILQWQQEGAKLPQLYYLQGKQWRWVGEFGCREFQGVKSRGIDIIQTCLQGKSSSLSVLKLKKAPLATKALARAATQRESVTVGKTTLMIKKDGGELQVGKKALTPSMFK
ncbi:MAG: hypothetical protein HN353_10565 [Bdellovibrionales bacterium]|jgi:hypothetical protein|nr:hypothetical protein [Bdellovibrionales bacterium]MBT3524736.1 hypothetical protein [Bdellovibrionales bacterium]MBT7668642.1 hypothetical protein [Bdellovibrionales bacterium]MBT7767129.1 hypothetical protein [Bdellovibrionales bacterium]